MLSLKYAFSMRSITLVKRSSPKPMSTLSSPRRLPSRICANCSPWRMYTGIFNKRFTGAIGCHGSMISVPSGVGCVVMVAWPKNSSRNHLRTSGSAPISVAATFTNACITSSLFAYPWSKYTLATSSGVKFAMSSLGIPLLMASPKASAVGPDMLTRSRMPRLTCASYCVLRPGRRSFEFASSEAKNKFALASASSTCLSKYATRTNSMHWRATWPCSLSPFSFAACSSADAILALRSSSFTYRSSHSIMASMTSKRLRSRW